MDQGALAMSILDSIPATIGAAFNDIFRDATLSRVTPGTSDGMGGYAQTIITDACKGLVTEYTAFQRQAAGIPSNERKVLVLASTLASGLAPKPGDRLLIQGRTWSVVDVSSDPANATYECRAK
jgi:hypothetical protein